MMESMIEVGEEKDCESNLDFIPVVVFVCTI
jgi:hypothetical protein